jgi:hypothetical protein
MMRNYFLATVPCNSTDEYQEGTRYIDATNYFNGAIVDICGEDWSAATKDVKEQFALYESWPLEYYPIPSTIAVSVDAAHIQTGCISTDLRMLSILQQFQQKDRLLRLPINST